MAKLRNTPWTRRRRMVWWGSLLTTVVLAAGWVAGAFRLLHVGWKFGAVVPPRSAAPLAEDPEASEWVFRARSVSFLTFRGQLELAHSEYHSLDATREGLDRWKTWTGWEVLNLPASIVGAADDAGTFVRGIGDWRVDAGWLGAAGVSRRGRMGEVIHVVEAPFWLLTVLAAAPGLVVWRRAARLAGRIRRGDCVHCGYPRAGGGAGGGGGGVCPECGREPHGVGGGGKLPG